LYTYESPISSIKIIICKGTLDVDIMQEHAINEYTAYNTIMHEIGHALGLRHSDNEHSLMYGEKHYYVNEEDIPLSKCEA